MREASFLVIILQTHRSKKDNHWVYNLFHSKPVPITQIMKISHNNRVGIPSGRIQRNQHINVNNHCWRNLQSNYLVRRGGSEVVRPPRCWHSIITDHHTYRASPEGRKVTGLLIRSDCRRITSLFVSVQSAPSQGYCCKTCQPLEHNKN